MSDLTPNDVRPLTMCPPNDDQSIFMEVGMTKTIYGIFFSLAIIVGCAKPFQPTPVEFAMWTKGKLSENQVKEGMFKCGFPSAAGFNGVYASVEEMASAEECMFREGFVREDGWKGICSLPKAKENSTCRNSDRFLRQ
jgi:hypothetical protein